MITRHQIKQLLVPARRLLRHTGLGRGRGLEADPGEPVRLIVGAGRTHIPGWQSVNIDRLDLLRERDWDHLLGDRRVHNILAEHVLEHLDLPDTVRALMLIHRFLAADGVFRMAVPDANHPSAYYRELTRPGGIGEGADDHRYFFSIGDVPALEKATGLKANPLEYFDPQGLFVAVPYEEAAGLVRRSSRRYAGPLSGSGERARRLLDTTPEPLREQFATLGITYTSLIVDWSKNTP